MWFLILSSDLHKSWLGGAVTNTMAVFWSPVDHISSYIGLKSQNNMLIEDNSMLMAQIRKSKADTTGESLIWAERGFNFEFLPAAIVSRIHNSRHDYIIIDRGWEDGVQVGDGIITAKGVIGIIQNSSSSFSYAISFNNNDFSVSARIGEEGHVGNLSWDGRAGGNGGVMTGIPVHVMFEPGDTVYTSGYSSVFPSDIPVGRVRSSKVMDGNSVRIDIDMLEDQNKVRHVMVVKNNDREELEELLNE